MKSRAVIKKSDDWWIGWLIDIPGVNAQERTRDELIESLIIGAQDMISINNESIKDGQVEVIDIPEEISS
ncbi:MAG: type II toxin-antitoxin system HicB family antitoxin [Nitrospirae bacterium]|nr:type II toxin-antitoxin system HicB family antitoxin [Nitrospirota bacterium]MBF0592054.1 type II toxin-antitoxin system HicB family antitoxin [Nitrospirota bacterium]